MRSFIARFGGLVLALVAVAAGVLVGRVIEAIAVGRRPVRHLDLRLAPREPSAR